MMHSHDADNCVIDSQSQSTLRHRTRLALESGLPKHFRRQLVVT